MDGNKTATVWNRCIFGDFEVPVSIYFRGWDAFPALEKYALSLCSGHILDIGAGSGCHSMALYRQGKKITALDISPLNASVMKNRGLPEVIEANAFEYNEKRHDTLLMLMNGIGFVGTMAGLERFLRHAHQLLKPGGTIIFDSTELLVENPKAKEINGKIRYYGEVEYTMRYKTITGAPLYWLFVDGKTLEACCEKTGWYMQKVFEDEVGHFLVRLQSLL